MQKYIHTHTHTNIDRFLNAHTQIDEHTHRWTNEERLTDKQID